MSDRPTVRNRRKVVYDASDEAQVKKAEEIEKDRERDLSYIVKEPRGRRWLYELIFDACHVSRPSHTPSDTHSTAFNEGARAVGERVLEELRTRHFSAFIQMLEENHDPTE